MNRGPGEIGGSALRSDCGHDLLDFHARTRKESPTLDVLFRLSDALGEKRRGERRAEWVDYLARGLFS
jgi:hypothetical protein